MFVEIRGTKRKKIGVKAASRRAFFWGLMVIVALVSVKRFTAYLSILKPATEQQTIGRVQPYDDDTLRIAIIGDSWAEYHADCHGSCDTLFAREAALYISRPVICRIWGRAGALTNQVYYDLLDGNGNDACGIRSLLGWHPDYCVIMSGINDLLKKRSMDDYVADYNLIVRCLLCHGICPVVMDIPMVDVDWVISNRAFYKRWIQYVIAQVAGTYSADVPAFRLALREMLKSTGLQDSVLFIAADDWTPTGWQDTTCYRKDRLHLNDRGYQMLDSYLAKEILRHVASLNGKKRLPKGNHQMFRTNSRE